MRIGGQQIDETMIARMQHTIDEHPGLSRTAVSRRICEKLEWRSRNGRLKEVNCWTALLKLQRAGALRLPEAKPFGGRRRARSSVEEIQPEAVMRRRLRDLQPVKLIRIVSADSEASQAWNNLMDRYHYLGAGPLCGAQLRYLIHSAAHGWLGKLSFSAGAWNVKARDCWIGWSAEVREQNLQQVVCNSRFLIVPQLKVPLLVETFIEQQRFAGTCYRAAKFIEVGRTQGRGRQDRSHLGGSSVKRVFVYPPAQTGPPAAVRRGTQRSAQPGARRHRSRRPARVGPGPRRRIDSLSTLR